MEYEIRRLYQEIEEIENRMLSSENEIEPREELIYYLETWIEMVSDQEFDVEKIRDDLQEQLVENDELLAAFRKPDGTEVDDKEKRLFYHVERRRRFIEGTSQDILDKEAALRGVRAAMAIVE